MPSDLADLWNAKSAQQRGVIRLCAAVRAADGEQLKVRRCCQPVTACSVCLASVRIACWALLRSVAAAYPGICTPMLSNAAGGRQSRHGMISRVSSEKACCGVVARIRQHVHA